MKKTIIIVLVIALAAVGLFIFNNRNAPTNISSTDNKILSTTSYKDYSGDQYALNQNGSKLIVVNSWASWCPFCKKELTDFINATSNYSPKDVTVIAVNRSETIDVSRGFSDELISNRLVFLLDLGDDFYKEIGGFSMPETLFMDSDLNVLEHKRGAMSEEEIEEKIKEHLKEI